MMNGSANSPEREKPYGLPLAVHIIVPFLVLFLFFSSVLFLIGFTSFRTSATAEHRRRTEELRNRIRSYLELFFSDPLRLVAFNEEFIRSGRLDLKEADDLAFLFASELRRYPYMTFISIGYPDGEYLGAVRPPDGTALSFYRASVNDGRRLDRYLITVDNRIGSLLERGPDYDARDRPWFQAAMVTDGRTWHPAYRFATSDDYGMGVSLKVLDNDGRFFGVLTADVALSEINRYLKGLLVEERGLAWVTDREGRLIASSADLPAHFAETEPADAGPVSGEETELYRQAMHALEEAGTEARQVPFRHGNEGFHTERLFVPVAPGLELGIGIAMPESALIGDLIENGRITSVIVLITALVVGLFGVFIALEVTGPISRIHNRARLLAKGDWSGPPVAPGQAKELIDLTEAFEMMASSLRNTLNGLEETVSQRTAALSTLLREVHHRMKNNFTLAAAMLSLQASQADSPRTAAALEEARERILSMALLYDRLYHSADMENAVAETYIASVVGELRSALIGPRPITLQHDLESFSLHPGKAAAVGIIVTELVTNACKYAFPMDTQGSIMVRARTRDMKLLLEVEDSGKGFPPGFDPSRDGGFGFTLVLALTGQYGGRCVLESAPGRSLVRVILDVLA